MSLDLLVNNRGERKYFGEITGPHTQFCTLSQISRQQALESNNVKKNGTREGDTPRSFLRQHFVNNTVERSFGLAKSWLTEKRLESFRGVLERGRILKKKKAFMQCFLCWLCVRDCVCERVKLAPRPSPPQRSWRRVWGTLLHIFLCAVFTNKVVLLQAYYEFWWGCCNYVRNIIYKWMKT